MSEIKYGKAKNIYDVLLNYTDGQTAEKIACPTAMPKTPDERKRSEWVNKLCAGLENEFDLITIEEIFQKCACGVPLSKSEKTKRFYESSADLDGFCKKFNKEYAPGNAVTMENGELYFSYPTCYCSHLKGIESVPRTWCLCSLGYAKNLFSYAFSREVQAELVESVKTGGKKCVMRII
jgi:hypothetical protein